MLYRFNIIPSLLAACSGLLTANASATSLPDLAGLYQVNQAYLNLTHCDTAGKPTDYASQFLRISATSKNENISYSVSTCNGDTIDELDCEGRSNRSRLDQISRHGIEGLRFSAREKTADDGSASCQLTALRRRILPGKGGFIRYERTDWGTTLADYQFECTRDTARLFYEAQSLNCSTHISIDASLIHAD